MPERPRGRGELAQRLHAVKLAAQLIIRGGPVARRDRPVTVAEGDHADLVPACLGADLCAPLLGIDPLRGADVPAMQKLSVVAGRALEVVADDPPKPLLVLRSHRSPDAAAKSPSAAIQLTRAADAIHPDLAREGWV